MTRELMQGFVRFRTLYYKEFMRFYSVKVQTIAAPLITTFLYLLIFGQVLDADVSAFSDVSYSQFMLPGLIMMTMMQNAFSNTSSSLIQSKMYGNLSFALLSPISAFEFTMAFILAATTRGIMVGIGVLLTSLFFVDVHIYSIFWIVSFALVSCMFMGGLGFIAGVLSKNFDQLSAFQNFIIVPLTFLSGVFYSLNNLSEFWRGVSLYNPFFYLVDGFRYGFFQHGDVALGISLFISMIFLAATLLISYWIVVKGYGIKQ